MHVESGGASPRRSSTAWSRRILATDRAGIVTFANLAALQTLGTSLADCVGRPVVELFGHHEGVAEVIRGAVPTHGEHRLDFPMISPGGTRFYVGMSITPAPPELRDEVGFIFLFRNLAETIDHETDPHIRLLASEDAPPAAAGARATAAAADEGASPDDTAPPRRMVLALRYTAPAEIARAAIESLCGRLEGDGAFVRLETADDVPEVLLDRQQATEALIILISSVLDRSTDPSDVRVRITRTEHDGKPGQAAAAARLEILGPPARITEEDLTAPASVGKRLPHRRMDLEIAEKLLEANGARLIRPGRGGNGPALSVLFRAAR